MKQKGEEESQNSTMIAILGTTRNRLLCLTDLKIKSVLFRVWNKVLIRCSDLEDPVQAIMSHRIQLVQRASDPNVP